MKRLLLALILPSPKALARWEETRRRSVARFVVVTGVTWLGLGLFLLALLDLLKPSGFFPALAHAFRTSPVKSAAVLVGASLGFGLAMAAFNEWAHRFARDRREP